MNMRKLLAISILLGLSSSCGDDIACPVNPTVAAGTPQITELRLIDAATRARLEEFQAMGDDPWLILLEVDFQDDDGDLGRGQVALYSRGEEVFTAELSQLFRQRGLALTASSGTLILAVRVASQPSGDSGQFELPLAVALTDQAGHVSECGSMYVGISYVMETNH